MGAVLTTGVQGTIAVIINLSQEVVYRTGLNVSSHQTSAIGQETGQKQSEQAR